MKKEQLQLPQEPRKLDPALTFDSIVAWIKQKSIEERAPGLIVGIIQGLVTAYLDPVVGGAIGTVFPFIIMLLILFIRPTGMFGWKTIERV